MNKEKVAELVRHYLKDCHPYGLTLEVVEPEIREGKGWWDVPIRLSIDPPKLSKLQDALVNVSIQIEENENLTVFFAPIFPKSEDSAEPQPPPKPKKKAGRATKKKVAALVRQHLKNCQPGDATLEVVEAHIYKSYYEWRVPIRPSFEPSNWMAYSEAFSEITTEILENEGWNIHLVLDEPASDTPDKPKMTH
jgi:hypothetical protein